MNTPPIAPSPQGGGRASLQSTTGRIAAVATALLLVLFLVLSVSRAAFTANTENPNNSIDVGGVTLTDNDADAALFTIAAADALPGADIVRCIQVRYEGNFSSGNVKMYATGLDGADPEVDPPLPIGDLAGFVNITVESIELGDVPLTPEVITPAVPAIVEDLANGIVAVPGIPAIHCTVFDVLEGALIAPETVATDYATATLAAFPGDYATGATDATDPFTATAPMTRYYKVTASVQNDPEAAGLSADWNFVWETATA